MLSGAFFVWQKGQIFIEPMLTYGHHGVFGIVKEKHQGRGDAFVTVCKIVACQFPLFDQSFGGGVVIVIRHSNSMQKNSTVYPFGSTVLLFYT